MESPTRRLDCPIRRLKCPIRRLKCPRRRLDCPRRRLDCLATRVLQRATHGLDGLVIPLELLVRVCESVLDLTQGLTAAGRRGGEGLEPGLQRLRGPLKPQKRRR